MNVISIATALVALSLTASVCAQSPLQSLSPFAANNSGAPGGAVYFDLTAGASDLKVDAFDINCNDATGGKPVSIDVYWRVGSSAGLGGNLAGWNFHCTDSGGVLTSIIDTPTKLQLMTPMCIPAGAVVGVAIVCNSTVGHAYTDGPLAAYSNADLSYTGQDASNLPFEGPLFSPRVANVNTYYSLGSCNYWAPVDLAAVFETQPGTGSLSREDGYFFDGGYLRWNFTSPQGSNAGVPGVVALNLGSAGSAAIGFTATIPGFDQVWFGSVPTGLAWFFPTTKVGGPDVAITAPPGVFFPGDTVRLQGLVLDAAHAQGVLPLVPTRAVLEYTFRNPCQLNEDFDALALGTGNYPLGWSNGGGVAEWSVDAGGTISAGTGPSKAASGTNYMYCEASTPRVVGDTFIMNTAVYASTQPIAGTLAFSLSRVGSTIGTLEVRMGDGTGTFPTLLATYQGNAAAGVEWQTETLALPSPLPANFQIQFHYVCGTSYTGDIAIDDVCIQ